MHLWPPKIKISPKIDAKVMLKLFHCWHIVLVALVVGVVGFGVIGEVVFVFVAGVIFVDVLVAGRSVGRSGIGTI